jgi:hypothetical protein
VTALDSAVEARLLRFLTEPGALEAEIAADRAQSHEEWLRDPYYPIRNLRAHGVEPSANALNTLDGPAVCDFCGATTYTEDGEAILAHESICMGCGSIVCDRPSCQTPGWCVSKHSPTLHGLESNGGANL